MTERRRSRSSRAGSPRRALDSVARIVWTKEQDRGGLEGDGGYKPLTVEGLKAELPGCIGKRIIEPGHEIEIYGGKDGLLRVRETCNGRTLDQTLDEVLLQDPWERLCFFSGTEP